MSRSVCFAAAMLLCAVLLSVPTRRAAAQSQPISQTRINEYAAILLRAKRALVEDIGLRRPNERLDAYIKRLVAPLPGESSAQRRARQTGYIKVFASLESPGKLVTVVPRLSDRSAANLTHWQRATAASAQLAYRYTDIRTETACLNQRFAVEKYTGSFEDQVVAEAIIKTLSMIKTAFEALREARP